jgi:hypothetical protein
MFALFHIFIYATINTIFYCEISLLDSIRSDTLEVVRWWYKQNNNLFHMGKVLFSPSNYNISPNFNPQLIKKSVRKDYQL